MSPSKLKMTSNATHDRLKPKKNSPQEPHKVSGVFWKKKTTDTNSFISIKVASEKNDV